MSQRSCKFITYEIWWKHHNESDIKAQKQHIFTSYPGQPFQLRTISIFFLSYHLTHCPVAGHWELFCQSDAGSPISVKSAPRGFLTINSSSSSMPRLLARKLVCFYCNRRSAQDRGVEIQQWKCEKCDAVNYLDKVSLSIHPELLTMLRLNRMAISWILLLRRSCHLCAMPSLVHVKPPPSQVSSAHSSARGASKTSIL